jgi:hypothetical protein
MFFIMKKFLIAGIVVMSIALLFLVFSPIISLNRYAFPNDCRKPLLNKGLPALTGCDMKKGVFFLNVPNIPSCMTIEAGGCIYPEVIFRNECHSVLYLDGEKVRERYYSLRLGDGFNSIKGQVLERDFKIRVFVTPNLCR